jgi:hypothetical protein
MRKHKVGDHVLVKLSGGRIVEAVVKAITESTDGEARSAQIESMVVC